MADKNTETVETPAPVTPKTDTPVYNQETGEFK